MNTNYPSVNSFESLPQNETLVTTKDLAKMLGVDVKTIQRVVTSLDINVERVGSSHTMMFNEQQATLIKIELQNHSKLARNGFNTVSISNDLEMMLMQQKLSEYQNMRIQQLTSELESANTQLIEQKPKVEYFDNFADSTSLIEIGHLGKKSGIGAKLIFPLMVGKEIIYKKHVDGVEYYEPYKEYEKYFTSIEQPFTKPDGTKKSRPKLYLTSRGYEFFCLSFLKQLKKPLIL